jgi:NADPH-dependent ferric siderophore reductase
VIRRRPSLAHTAKLLEAQVSLLGRRGSRFLLRAIFDVCLVEDGDGASAIAAALMNLVQRLVIASVELQTDDTVVKGSSDLNETVTTATAWVQSLAPNESTVSWATWLDWATTTAPDIHRPLSTAFHLFLLGRDYSFRPEPLQLPTFSTSTTTATAAATNGNNKAADNTRYRHLLPSCHWAVAGDDCTGAIKTACPFPPFGKPC